MSLRSPAWDPSKGESRPRGLPYLEKVLAHPRGAAAKLAAFVRFRIYVEKRLGRTSRPNALDRAKLNEYRDGNPYEVSAHRHELAMPQAVWSVVYGLAIASNCAPKTILEALLLIGLEQTSSSLRATDAAPNIVPDTVSGARTLADVAA